MDNQITFEKVNHIFYQGQSKMIKGLNDVTLSFNPNSVNMIIGKTGSGKSTLVKHLNGLLKPSSGVISLGEFVIDSASNDRDFREIRKKVGMVFQFPEKQLFAETVLNDIKFGPSNFGLSDEEASHQAVLAAKTVGLPKSLLNSSPFDLSGGQQRRVAIAGVLACNPPILVLDEPTVGLDEQGKEQIIKLIMSLQKQRKLTVIMITHDMELVGKYADNVIVMKNGTNIFSGTPKQLFNDNLLLKKADLVPPQAFQFAQKLEKAGLNFNHLPLTNEDLVKELVQKQGDRHE